MLQKAGLTKDEKKMRRSLVVELLVAGAVITGVATYVWYASNQDMYEAEFVEPTIEAMIILRESLEGFYSANGRYPATLKEVINTKAGGHSPTPPLDAWGLPIRYLPPSDLKGPYEIWSAGRDGKDKTDDDLVLPAHGRNSKNHTRDRG